MTKGKSRSKLPGFRRPLTFTLNKLSNKSLKLTFVSVTLLQGTGFIYLYMVEGVLRSLNFFYSFTFYFDQILNRVVCLNSVVR
jgi:hypothetical protein